ncbi:transposase [Petroclostridium sp. X23]|uniref:IS66 family transposase n=1 Tax=Petroclostridium sp. X23 TaxID=3045146 RepID=UPI0024ACD9A6|nr:transposase [Petroclostridium sp. X23]WHH59689.1 transposase [Petroclostridium sp. X23]
MSYDEKKEKRQEASRTILDVFWSWVEETSALSTTNENLTKALNYAKNQKKYLETFLEDGRLPISNNSIRGKYQTLCHGKKSLAFC